MYEPEFTTNREVEQNEMETDGVYIEFAQLDEYHDGWYGSFSQFGLVEEGAPEYVFVNGARYELVEVQGSRDGGAYVYERDGADRSVILEVR